MQLPTRKPGKYSSQKKDYYISQKRYNALVALLKKLKNKRPKAALEVSRLAELGDFSENVEYQLAKRTLRGINTKMLHLEHEINRAIIINPSPDTNRVEIGHRVTILKDDREITYQILGSQETDPKKNIISYTSPMGSALLGKQKGDAVEIILPKKTIECAIVNITI